MTDRGAPLTGGGGGVDARTDRIVQATIGILLLSAFVFRLPWLPPIVGIVLAIGALAGPAGDPLHWAFTAWIAPRLPAAEDTVPADTVRAQDALGALVLAVAGVAYLLGIDVVAWLLTVAEAVVAIVAATTGVHVGELVAHLLHR